MESVLQTSVLTTEAISTLIDEVASLKHVVSLFPGCNNTVMISCLTWTIWQLPKSGSPCFVSWRQECVSTHQELYTDRGKEACKCRGTVADTKSRKSHVCFKSILHHLIIADILQRLLRHQDKSRELIKYITSDKVANYSTSNTVPLN